MGDGSLTQEEIDLLLKGTDAITPTGAPAPMSAMGGGMSDDMSPLERETVADIILQALQSGTQGLGVILSRNVTLGAPYVEVKTQDGLSKELGQDNVVFTQQYSGALNGVLGLFLASESAEKISAIVMGDESG